MMPKSKCKNSIQNRHSAEAISWDWVYMEMERMVVSHSALWAIGFGGHLKSSSDEKWPRGNSRTITEKND
jgi:hypothetical protein